MTEHVIDHLEIPTLMELEPNLYVVRFESMKLESADHAVESLLESGEIGQETTVVDSSSGVYAVALAMAAHKHGIRAHIVGSAVMDDATAVQVESFGATVERVPPQGSLHRDQSERIRRIQVYLAAHENSYWMRQYHDPIHLAGYRRTASRFTFRSVPREIDLVGSVGSGSSTKGMWQGLSEIAPTRVHGIQSFGSVTFGSEQVQDPDMVIAGIGSAIHFDNVDHEIYESIDWIGYDLAIGATLAMYRDWTLFSGLSTGCSFAVARKVLTGERSETRPTVMISADTGHRYASALRNVDRSALLRSYEAAEPVMVKSPQGLRLPWSRAVREDLSDGWEEFKG